MPHSTSEVNIKIYRVCKDYEAMILGGGMATVIKMAKSLFHPISSKASKHELIYTRYTCTYPKYI